MAPQETEREINRLLSLQREDPIEFWLRRAHENALRLHLPVEFLGEAISIVTSALSEGWVRKQVVKQRQVVTRWQGLMAIFQGHPLVDALAVAGDPQLVMVIELAVYLKSLCQVDGLNDVIPVLQGEHSFQSALLQLAYAYRFRKMGCQVRLEPAAARGRRGDIQLTWRGTEYLVECYIPREGQEPLKDVLAFSLNKMTSAASEFGKAVRILIKFSVYPDHPQRSELEKMTIQLIRHVPQGGAVAATVGCADIEVQEITGQPDSDFLEDGQPNENSPYVSTSDGFSSIELADVETILRPDSSSSLANYHQSRVFWWRPPQEGRLLMESMSKLSDQIAEKLDQTRAPQGRAAKRIVIAQGSEARERNEVGRRIAQGVQQCLIPKHRDIAGIILTSRVWTHQHRFRYYAYLLKGRDRDEIIDEVYEKIGNIDFTFDLLHDWR